MLIGTANIDTLAAAAPVIERLDGDAVTFQQAEVLQVTYEIATPQRTAMLPPALHPSDPPLVTWVFYRCPVSPWGPFAMAQTRIQCRSGLRLRAFLVSAVVDNTAAAVALSTRWGFKTQGGHIALHRHYDSLQAMVTTHGRTILDVLASDPEPLSAADIQYVANMNLAHTPRGLRLVQVEPHCQIERVERARPRISAFDAPAWGEVHLQPVYAVSASSAVADLTLPRIRFLCRPDVLAFDGTETVG